MTTETINKAVWFTAADVPAIREIVKIVDGDGHTIWKDTAFTLLRPELRERFSREYESDGSHKGDIYGHDGQVIPKVRGIYGLTLVEGIAHDLNIPSSGAMGRGFRCREICANINNWLKTQGN